MNDEQNYVQVIVRVPPWMHQAIKARAEEEERTMSVLIRRALREHMQLEEPAA